MAGPTYTLLAAVNSGNLYSTCCRLYTPTLPVYGTTSTAANTITNAGTQDGTNAFMTTDIVAGDSVWIDKFKDDSWPVAANPIATVAAGTITMQAAQNALLNWVFPTKRWPWFLREPPANV